MLVKLEAKAQEEGLKAAQEEWDLKRSSQVEGDADAEQLEDDGEVRRAV